MGLFDEAPLHPKNVTEDRLRDPGFGFGPLCFREISSFDVLREPPDRLNESDRKAYRETYEFFSDIVEATPGVVVSSDKITWTAPHGDSM